MGKILKYFHHNWYKFCNTHLKEWICFIKGGIHHTPRGGQVKNDLYRHALIAHYTGVLQHMDFYLTERLTHLNFACKSLNIWILQGYLLLTYLLTYLIFFCFHSIDFLFKAISFQLRTHLTLKRSLFLN